MTMAMIRSVSVTVRMVIMGMAANFYVATAESASTFFAHIIQAPVRRFPAHARVANRR
jgi:hypothetical protein